MTGELRELSKVAQIFSLQEDSPLSRADLFQRTCSGNFVARFPNPPTNRQASQRRSGCAPGSHSYADEYHQCPGAATSPRLTGFC